MATMRHPLLRILVALLIGVVTPLCCCQATAIVGSGCGEPHTAAIKPNSCCNGCADDPASKQHRDAPTDNEPPAPGKCPSCPSCDGTPAGTAINVEARLPAFEHDWDVIATLALAVLWDLPSLETRVTASPPGWASDPPFLKANREAQRWYCALVV